MNTQISTKLTALAVALVMNSLLIGGVAYLFDGYLQQHPTIISLAHTAVSQITGAEFFEAVVDLESVSAVVVRAKK